MCHNVDVKAINDRLDKIRRTLAGETATEGFNNKISYPESEAGRSFACLQPVLTFSA